MIDDDDSKARRNLVIFASALLLLAWLQIPLTGVAQKLGAPERWSGDQLRIWSAAGLILLYLAVRFHFSGGGKEAFSELKKLYGSRLHWELDPKVKAQAASSGSEWFSPKLDDVLLNAETMFAGRGYSGERRRDVNVQQVATPERPGWCLAGPVVVRVTWLNSAMDPPTAIYHHEREITYTVPLRARLLAVTRAAWLSWIFSERAVASGVPFGLAVLASGLIGWKLGTAFYALSL